MWRNYNVLIILQIHKNKNQLTNMTYMCPVRFFIIELQDKNEISYSYQEAVIK